MLRRDAAAFVGHYNIQLPLPQQPRANQARDLGGCTQVGLSSIWVHLQEASSSDTFSDAWLCCRGFAAEISIKATPGHFTPETDPICRVWGVHHKEAAIRLCSGVDTSQTNVEVTSSFGSERLLSCQAHWLIHTLPTPVILGRRLYGG